RQSGRRSWTSPAAIRPPVVDQPAAEPAPPSPDVQPLGQLDAAAVRRVWQALLDAVREQSRATQVLFSNSTASAVEGNTLVLSLPTAPLARRLGEERNIEMIKKALHSVLGVDWQVRCEHPGASAGPSSPGRPVARRPEAPPQRQAPRRPEVSLPPADSVPPPPEPPDPENLSAPPPIDDEAMHSARLDPEQVALELLTEQLGARRID
ncbi:MAG TPA: DNA polymerase III subunit gamma/tau, partial [Pseudonocardiaceae bacterium]|nr:DNA polymerase III subunit gamma/tau [Pseudonocardiaceae bacterium]